MGLTSTEATRPRATWPPDGVSIGSARRLLRSRRVAGVLHAETRYSAPPAEISDMGSLAISTAAARRTWPGVSP